MAAQQPDTSLPRHHRLTGKRLRPADSYGIVLLLIVVDYITVSALVENAWAEVVIVALHGSTLVFALRIAGVRRIWQFLAVAYLLASTLLTLAGAAVPASPAVGQLTTIVGGLLLLITTIAIIRSVSMHEVVTTETVLGAICVYLLFGFSFAFIYKAISFVGSGPFFIKHVHATAQDYLFFSYTTLTTVGYGNLVPADSLGQSFAVLEALVGQIYLVIIVARLVSLWGLAIPRAAARRAETRAETRASTTDSPLTQDKDSAAATDGAGSGRGERP